MSDAPRRVPPSSADDPFLAAHEAAEWDDEPYTDEDRAAAEEGWQAYLRGESSPWEEVRRELFGEERSGRGTDR